MDHVKEQIHWEAAYEMGLTGKGAGVAVLDTGLFPHRDFEDRIAGFADMVNHNPGPYDDCGHGTHICGIIGGSGVSSGGRYQGIAPGCTLTAVKVLDRRGNGSVTDVLAGIDWVLRHREQLGIRILNISVGSCTRKGMSANSALVKGVDRGWDEGLVVVVAAGNRGPGRMTITTPGISRKVITVGCSDDDREVLVGGNRMVDYSGRGPTAACVCKPDVTAPGAYIRSCSADFEKPGHRLYTEKSGTSMATPVVSGSLALLLSADRELTNKQVKLKLRSSCRNLGLPRNQQGWGQIWVPGLLGIRE